jgi:hypothetical protein
MSLTYNRRVTPVIRAQIVALAVLTGLATPALGRPKVPDIVPGPAWGLLREVTVGPFRFSLYEAGDERDLRVSLAGRAKRHEQAVVIDAGGKEVGGEPPGPVVEVTPLDDRTPDLFLVHVTARSSAAGLSVRETRFLVRRENPKPRLVCQLPGGPLKVSVSAVEPSLELSVCGGPECLRFVARGDDLCTLEGPSAPSPASPNDFLRAATVVQGGMFRTAERWRDAAASFQRALHLRPTGQGAEWLALEVIHMRSDYNDLQCWPSDPGDFHELPIDGLLKLLVESYDEYLSYFPGTEMAGNVRYQKAGLLELCNRLEEAALFYKEVFDRSPEHPLSVYAREGHARVVELIRRRDATKPPPTERSPAAPARR